MMPGVYLYKSFALPEVKNTEIRVRKIAFPV